MGLPEGLSAPCHRPHLPQISHPPLPGEEGKRQKEACKSQALAGLAQFLGKHQADTFTLRSSSDQRQMSLPRQQPYLGPRGQQGLPHHSRGACWSARGYVPQTAQKPPGQEESGEQRSWGRRREHPLERGSSLLWQVCLTDGDAATLPVPLRGGAWTRSPQEHPHPQERARRSPALWASASQGMGSTKNLRRHAEASWRSDSPGLGGQWGTNSHIFYRVPWLLPMHWQV